MGVRTAEPKRQGHSVVRQDDFLVVIGWLSCLG